MLMRASMGAGVVPASASPMQAASAASNMPLPGSSKRPATYTTRNKIASEGTLHIEATTKVYNNMEHCQKRECVALCSQKNASAG